LLLVLALAAMLRLYALDAPSMWWDEIYTPMTSRYPLRYILDWCRGIEIQPPYFYFTMKAVMAAGTSDFALRFPFALAGLATVAATYRLGRLALGPWAGLAAAALVAFDPMLLWLSRTLRVYPLLHLGWAASLVLLFEAFDRGRRRAEIGLYAVNLALLLLHYSAVLMVGAQFAALLAWRVLTPRPGSMKTLVRFSLVSLASFAPAAPFFFTGMVEGHRLDAHSSLLAVLRKVVLLLEQDMTFLGLPWTGPALFVLAALGAVLLWRKKRNAAVLLAFAATLPAAAVVAQRYDSHLFAYHLSFLIIPLAVLAGAPLGLLRPRPAAAGLVAIFAALSIHWALGSARGQLYEPDSYGHGLFYLGDFKATARAAPPAIADSPVLCPDLTLFNAINWYLDQYADPNPLVRQHLDRARTDTDLLVWSGFDDFGHLAKDRDAFLARYPDVRPQPALSTIRPYRLRIARRQLAVTGPGPAIFHLDAAPEHFYRDVAALSGVMLRPFFGNGVMPTANESWGSFEYDIRNALAAVQPDVTLVAHYANKGRDNRVEIDYRLDGGPWRQAMASRGPDAATQAVAKLAIDRPWRELTVRCRLWCAPLTPMSGGSNLPTVTVKGLDFYVCGPDEAGDCASRMAVDLLPQGFPAMGGPPQALEGTDNVSFREAPEAPGWGFYAPTDPARTGEIRLCLSGNGAAPVFYPRVSGRQSAVSVAAEGKTHSLSGLPDAWTPMGLAVPLPGKGGPGDVVFRLTGPSAQLWSHEGRLVFFMPNGQEKAP
jgi:hypothetical protein